MDEILLEPLPQERKSPRLLLENLPEKIRRQDPVTFLPRASFCQFEGALQCISENGIYIATSYVPQLSTIVVLQFRFLKFSFRCHGRVIYGNRLSTKAQTQGFGVKFVDMTEADQMILRKAIEIHYPMTEKVSQLPDPA